MAAAGPIGGILMIRCADFMAEGDGVLQGNTPPHGGILTVLFIRNEQPHIVKDPFGNADAGCVDDRAAMNQSLEVVGNNPFPRGRWYVRIILEPDGSVRLNKTKRGDIGT